MSLEACRKTKTLCILNNAVLIYYVSLEDQIYHKIKYLKSIICSITEFKVVTAGKPKHIKKGLLLKPKTASLFSTMDLNTITCEVALRLLLQPNVLGNSSAGIEITVPNGSLGLYSKADTDSGTIRNENQIYTITLDEALEI